MSLYLNGLDENGDLVGVYYFNKLKVGYC